MSIFNSINIAASALTSQRLRMDITSANIANADSTRAELVDGEWQPYRRKMPVLKANEAGNRFSNFLSQASSRQQQQVGNGVVVSEIVEDESPFKMVYRPEHPDAGEDGYVQMPNVDPLKEMVNLMGATRAYEANVTTMNASKNMLMKALEIGR